MTRAKTAQHRVCGGIFTPDPEIPAEVRVVKGERVVRHVCRCGLLGQAGDAHHTVAPPSVDARGLAAGERSEG